MTTSLQKASSRNPLVCLFPRHDPWIQSGSLSFTLIELMAASTVLSIVLLLMVGMQSQMSKAWSNANRRTDANREARAASQLLAADLAYPIVRYNTSYAQKDQIAASASNKGLPFVYSSTGTGLSASNSQGGNIGLTIPNLLANSSCLFFATSVRPRVNQTADLALVGYYVAQDVLTNVNGFRTVSYNLHRYFRSSNEAATNLVNWFTSLANTNATPTAGLLFPAIDVLRDEILARNVANFRILFFNPSTEVQITNGINYTNPSSASANNYAGNKIQISLDIYPEDAAQKFQTPTDWADPGNIRRFSRSYEFRIDSPRS